MLSSESPTGTCIYTQNPQTEFGSEPRTSLQSQEVPIIGQFLTQIHCFQIIIIRRLLVYIVFNLEFHRVISLDITSFTWQHHSSLRQRQCDHGNYERSSNCIQQPSNVIIILYNIGSTDDDDWKSEWTKFQ